MVYIVDTVELEPKDCEKYLDSVKNIGVPAMEAAGLKFISCWATSKELGEDVKVLVVWAVEDHSRWNDVRKNLVFTPEWHEYAQQVETLRKSGSRNFYYPTDFSRFQ